jgi:tetratricopeptide (TPR) repeat protein
MSQLKQKSPPPLAKPSPKKVILFKAISILLSFLILGLLEIALRFFHYGYDLSLFIDYSGDRNYMVFNPNASKKYFSNQEIATVGNSELFKKKKDGNTLRIFVLGESTTIGYPYFHNGSFHRWLQYRLSHSFPDKNFEIINIALTAVNSYTVLGFAREVVDYEPDAVLIYTGHNEYYGALGVGSTENIGGNPRLVNLLLSLRDFRITQLITNLYGNLQNAFASGKAGSGGTRMKLMVADQQIPYQSVLYKRGVEQFRANMNETLELFNKQNIPVFISNLVSNEKDLKPFVSFPVDGLQFPEFKKNFNLGLKALRQKDNYSAYTYFKTADQNYNSHALCEYYLGKLAYNRGDFKRAKAYFSKARDLDGLRFRAPAELNTVIDQLCRTYKNAHLVDTKAAFEANSANGIIGDELILEHVHPDLRGYSILSDVFYEVLKKNNLISVNAEKEMSYNQLVHHMPITNVDSLAGIYTVTRLKKSWPFSEALAVSSIRIESEEDKIAYDLSTKRIEWLEAISRLYTFYSENRDLAKAKTAVEALVLEYPTDVQYYEKAAMLSGELKDYKNAVFYFKKAFEMAPTFDKARFLFVIYLKLDQPTEAIPYLNYAIANNASGMNLGPVKQFAEQVIQLQNAYVRDSANISILNQIANTYFRMDNQDGAAKYVRKVLKADADNKDALALLSLIKK